MTGKTEVDPLTAYLDYYKNLVNPGYAVLVTGEWGCGKTHQVKQALDKDEYHYISLFGLQDLTALYGAILAKTNPDAFNRKRMANWAKDKSVSAFGFGFPVGGIISAGFDATVSDKVDNAKLLIFDDLERSNIDIQVLSGVLNRYVEHHLCRVVVIAHNEKMVAEFRTTKEKVFGQTIRVTPKTKEAVDSFIAEATDPTKAFIAVHRQTIDAIFELSQCKSLRIFRQIILDIARFHSLFTPEQLGNRSAMNELLALFVAIEIEVRSGLLDRNDISGRSNNYMLGSISVRDLLKKNDPTGEAAQVERQPIVASYNKYASYVELIDQSLSDELIIAMVIDGKFEKQALQNSESVIAKFSTPKDAPAWYNFMNFRSLSDAIVEQAINRMDDQFNNRESLVIGEFLHLVSLRFMRAKNGLLQETQEETVSRSKSYLDDLVTNGWFPISVDDELFGSHPAYGGYVFWIEEDYQSKFKEILDYLPECRDRGNKLRANRFKSELLNALRSGPEEFNRQINYSKDQKAVFHDVPVLSCIPPEEFVEAFLKIPVADWRQIMAALKSRRDVYASHQSFSVEHEWFRQLTAEMIAAADRAGNAISALRIRRYLLTP